MSQEGEIAEDIEPLQKLEAPADADLNHDQNDAVMKSDGFKEDDENKKDDQDSITSNDETNADNNSVENDQKEQAEDNPSSSPTKKKRKRSSISMTKRKVSISNEAPNTKDLFVPFRVVKRIMKVDKDIGTVQNEAAMVATYALEMFIETLVHESHENAKKRGSSTIK